MSLPRSVSPSAEGTQPPRLSGPRWMRGHSGLSGSGSGLEVCSGLWPGVQGDAPIPKESRSLVRASGGPQARPSLWGFWKEPRPQKRAPCGSLWAGELTTQHFLQIYLCCHRPVCPSTCDLNRNGFVAFSLKIESHKGDILIVHQRRGRGRGAWLRGLSATAPSLRTGTPGRAQEPLEQPDQVAEARVTSWGALWNCSSDMRL